MSGAGFPAEAKPPPPLEQTDSQVRKESTMHVQTKSKKKHLLPLALIIAMAAVMAGLCVVSWSERGRLQNELEAQQQQLNVAQRRVQQAEQELSDLQEEFDLLFRFGKEERPVTCYLLSEYGQDTGIYASFEHLNQKLEIQVEEDSLVTALRVTGGEGIYTEDVIPAPSGLLICLDYYLDPRFMSPDTIAAWEAYQEPYQAAPEAYGEKLLLW